MSRGFIKGSEIMSTDGVRHDKEKYFEEKESKGFVNSHYKEVKENKETNSKSAQSNKEKLPKLSSEGGLNDQNQDNQMIREEEEDKEWRLKMFRPSEEELYARQIYDRHQIEEERLKSNQEKEILENFKAAQAKLLIKNEGKIKKLILNTETDNTIKPVIECKDKSTLLLKKLRLRNSSREQNEESPERPKTNFPVATGPGNLVIISEKTNSQDSNLQNLPHIEKKDSKEFKLIGLNSCKSKNSNPNTPKSINNTTPKAVIKTNSLLKIFQNYKDNEEK